LNELATEDKNDNNTLNELATEDKNDNNINKK